MKQNKELIIKEISEEMFKNKDFTFERNVFLKKNIGYKYGIKLKKIGEKDILFLVMRSLVELIMYNENDNSNFYYRDLRELEYSWINLF